MIFGWFMTLELVFFCSNLKLSGLFFDVLWYIDLIFGMWLYLDELQFKFEFRYGRLTFGWVMAIEHVFYVQILSCPDFFLTSFDILTWYLVCGYIWMSYSVRSNFVPIEWLLADLWPLNLYFCSNVKLSGLFLDVLWYIDLIFGIWLYLDELLFKLEFCSGRMIFGWVMALELVFFVQIWSCPDFSLTSFDILTWYLVSGYIGMSYSVHLNFVPVEWLLAELWPSNLYILFKFEVVRTFLWRPLIYWLDIWYVAIYIWVTV